MYIRLSIHFSNITLSLVDQRFCTWRSQLVLIMAGCVGVAKPLTKTSRDYHHKTGTAVTSLLHQAIDIFYTFIKTLQYIQKGSNWNTKSTYISNKLNGMISNTSQLSPYSGVCDLFHHNIAWGFNVLGFIMLCSTVRYIIYDAHVYICIWYANVELTLWVPVWYHIYVILY